MTSRATRYLTPVLRSGFRSPQTVFRASGRRMTTTTSPSKQSSDMPWIIGSAVVFVPTIAWILSSGKGEKHAHPTPEPKERVEVVESVSEAPREPVSEPVTAEQTPEPVAEEKPAETTSEPITSQSVVSDDEGVAISKEEVEESINKAIDVDAPKEAKAVEATEATSSEHTSIRQESEPVDEREVIAPPKAENAESTTPQSEASTGKEESKGH